MVVKFGKWKNQQLSFANESTFIKQPVYKVQVCRRSILVLLYYGIWIAVYLCEMNLVKLACKKG